MSLCTARTHNARDFVSKGDREIEETTGRLEVDNLTNPVFEIGFLCVYLRYVMKANALMCMLLSQ